MAVLFLSLLLAQIPRPGPWVLTRAEIQVRPASVPGRYRVHAYLTLVPPPNAHPDLDPGPLVLRFPGDGRHQDLRFLVTRINEREVLRRLVSVEPTGSRVMLAVEPAFRTLPWAVELEVELSAEGGAVSLPTYPHAATGDFVVVDPRGRRRRYKRPPSALRVEPRPLLPWLLGAFGLAGAVLLALARKRRRHT